jgi:membrane complex biogenesis BtpA family protein
MFVPRPPLDLSSKPIIGMVHLPPLDQAFDMSNTDDSIFEISLQDAIALEEAGFDAILIENFHDTPFPKYRLDDEKFILMSTIVKEVGSKISIPWGVNVLRNACVQALIMATVNKGSFIRCNIYEGAYVTDQGIIESVAKDVQKKKREINSKVQILADVHVKHATPLGDFSLEEAAKNAITREGADAIIVSGKTTGTLIEISRLKNFVEMTKIKPILGSGLSSNNLSEVFPYISGAIVGSSIKVADISSPIDIEKAKTKIQALWKAVGLSWKPEGRDHPSRIVTQMERKNVFFLGEVDDDDDLIGVIMVSHDGRKGWINRLAVHPEHHHKGIAQKLLEIAEDQLFRIEGIEVCSALIFDDNKPSLSLFEKVGYESWGSVRYYSKRKRPEA